MYLLKRMTYAIMMPLIAATACWGQLDDQVDRSSYQQIVIIMQQPGALALPNTLMQAVLSELPLQQIAEQALGEETTVTVVEASLIPNVVLGGLADLGSAAYLQIAFEGHLSADEQRSLWLGIMNGFSERLSAAVAGVEEHRLAGRHRKLDRLQGQLRQARDDVERYSHEMNTLEQNYSGMSADQLRKQIQGLAERLRELELKLIAWEARRDAIEKRIVRVRAEAEEQSKDDPVLTELAQLVKLKERVVAGLQHAAAKSGKVSLDRVASAEADVSEAKIKLLEHRHKQVDDALASRISTLNTQLAEGMIEMVESRRMAKELAARLEIAKNLLNEMQRASAEKQMLQTRLNLAMRRLETILHQLDELKASAPEPTSVRIVPWAQ